MKRFDCLNGVICSLLILLCTVQGAWARDIFVDGNNPLASDTNAGSTDKPLKTIAYSAKIAIAGDTVNVRNGVYREFIEVVNSGSDPDKMITFRADGNKVFVKGSDEVSGWILLKGNIWKKEGWQVNSQQVFVDGVVLEQIGGNPLFSPGRLPAKGSGITDMIPGSFYYDEKGKTLYAWLKDNGNPNKHLIEASTRALILRLKWKNYINIQNFNFLHSNNTATIKSGWPAVAINGNGCVIENNNISWCDFTGLGGNCNGAIIRSNRCNYNGDSGIVFSGSNIVLEGNETNYNNYRNFNYDWHAGGMKNTQLSNSKVFRHTAVNNNGHGIWFDIDCVNNIIESSIATDNKGNGIFYEISDSGLIRNNISAKNGVNGIYISSSKNCRVFNNLVYGNSYGIVLHGPRDNHGLINNVIQNNIITNSANAEIVIPPPNNNIVIGKSVKDNYSDFNLIYNNKGKAQMKIGSGAKLTVNHSNWINATGNDRHSLELDPLLEISSKWKLRPSKNSPVRGAGMINHEVLNDIEFKLRPANRNDIGPFTIQ